MSNEHLQHSKKTFLFLIILCAGGILLALFVAAMLSKGDATLPLAVSSAIFGGVFALSSIFIFWNLNWGKLPVAHAVFSTYIGRGIWMHILILIVGTAVI
jgi:hypothetical protein